MRQELEMPCAVGLLKEEVGIRIGSSEERGVPWAGETLTSRWHPYCLGRNNEENPCFLFICDLLMATDKILCFLSIIILIN